MASLQPVAPLTSHLSEELALQLIREGSSLLDRLRAASARLQGAELPAGCDSVRTSAHLEAWRRIVAPDRPINFQKRLIWDGLTEADALWAAPVQGSGQRRVVIDSAERLTAT